MKKVATFFCLLLCLSFLFSCDTAPEYKKQSFFAMDTLAEIRIYSDHEKVAEVFAECKALTAELEKAISVTYEGGDLVRFNASESGIEDASEHLLALIAISSEISRLTGGSFDIRAGALIALWKQCEEEGRLPTDAEIAAAVALVDGDISTVGTEVSKSDAALKLDFGAVGKGYAADLLKAELLKKGVSCGMISFVSSITVFGERETGDFRIAIRRPDASGEIAGYITLRDMSLSVSGNYERYYEIGGQKYDHILDPATGYPADNRIDSVVVTTPNGAYADALSTAITVMGAEETLALYQNGSIPFEAAIFCGNEILVTDGFSENFSPVDGRYTVVRLSDRI